MKTGEKLQAASLKQNRGQAPTQVPTCRAVGTPAECCHLASLGSGPKNSPQKFKLRYSVQVTLGWWYLRPHRCSADSARGVQRVPLCSATLPTRTHQTLEQYMAAFSPPERRGEGWKGAVAPSVPVRERVQLRKKSPQHLTTRTRDL